MLTTSVMRKSTKPAASSAESWAALASPKRPAISAETELLPISVRFGFTSNVGLMMRTTAIVSPSARPRPSMVPPMMPPRPKGSTTEVIIPHLVAPSASAASFSPCGVWEKTWRITAHAIGSTIIATAMPAQKLLET